MGNFGYQERESNENVPLLLWRYDEYRARERPYYLLDEAVPAGLAVV